MVGDADQCLEADFFNHELALGEELASEAFEQVGLDLLATESEIAQFEGRRV